jgi:hypothetical protein
MFGTSWRVGRIAGIEVRVDSSWVVIALLITYSMYLQVSQMYDVSGGEAVGIGVLSVPLAGTLGCLAWTNLLACSAVLPP